MLTRNMFSCLRNVLALFHTISRENAWRESQGLEAGFVGLTASKPIVAVGAEAPLADQKALADFFRMQASANYADGLTTRCRRGGWAGRDLDQRTCGRKCRRALTHADEILTARLVYDGANN